MRAGWSSSVGDGRGFEGEDEGGDHALELGLGECESDLPVECTAAPGTPASLVEAIRMKVRRQRRGRIWKSTRTPIRGLPGSLARRCALFCFFFSQAQADPACVSFPFRCFLRLPRRQGKSRPTNEKQQRGHADGLINDITWHARVLQLIQTSPCQQSRSSQPMSKFGAAFYLALRSSATTLPANSWLNPSNPLPSSASGGRSNILICPLRDSVTRQLGRMVRPEKMSAESVLTMMGCSIATSSRRGEGWKMGSMRSVEERGRCDTDSR